MEIEWFFSPLLLLPFFPLPEFLSLQNPLFLSLYKTHLRFVFRFPISLSFLPFSSIYFFYVFFAHCSNLFNFSQTCLKNFTCSFTSTTLNFATKHKLVLFLLFCLFLFWHCACLLPQLEFIVALIRVLGVFIVTDFVCQFYLFSNGTLLGAIKLLMNLV